MLIGCGPHAKRIYVPLFEKFKNRATLKCIIDICEKEKDVTEFMEKFTIDCDNYFISSEHKTFDELNDVVEKRLNDLVSQHNINGVVIATEPLTHVMYAKWALKNNLNILMDKPVSTYKNISTTPKLAKKILEDYDELADIYSRKKSLSFSLMSQRRFHPAFQKVKSLIKEVSDKTNCPVTSIQSFHCDGQWRLPSEIVDQIYHPYCQGYGKASHSGYHFLDILPFLIDSSYSKNKKYDTVTCTSNAIRPLDFLSQINFEDYENIFGKDNFHKHNKYSVSELNNLMEGYGEIDVFSNYEFKRDGKTITLGSLNMAHNGFGQRNWVTAEGRDLYKGNGRVRQESHIIQQGPFQAIHYHSYQSKEVDPSKNSNLYDVGGEYHLDIYIFRNSNLIGGQAFQKISVENLDLNIMEGKSRGHQENARAQGFLEFIDFMEGKRSQSEMTSDFLTHRMGSVLTSLLYQSLCNDKLKNNPKVSMRVE